MKILLIHQYFLEKGEGGGSRFNEMTKVWSDAGHEITVISGMVHYATGRKPEKYKNKFTCVDRDYYPGVTVVRSHVSQAYNSNFAGRLWAYFSFVFSGIYAGLFKTGRNYDIILVTSPPLFVGIIAYVLSLFKGVPFVFEVRDLWPESAIDTGVLNNKVLIRFAYWFERFIYRKARKINVLTPAFRNTLISEKNIPQDKVFMIPNGADFSLSGALSKSFDAQKFKSELGFADKFVLTYVGAHGVANDLMQLIDAAERIKNYPIVIQLIGDGMQKEKLQREVQKRKLVNVIFREPVPKEEVFKFILASDVGISVLKKVETFKTIYSNKTFDYMACRKPVLLAIDGVSRQLVEDAGCGIYVEPENIDDIASGMIHFYEMDREKLKIMGENGYLYAKKHFDRTVLAKKYMGELIEISSKQ